MRFILRSRRDIPANERDRQQQKAAKNDIRHQFHRQLRNLWNWTPFLKAQLDAGLPLGTVATRRISIEGSPPFYGAKLSDIDFYPLITHGGPWVCEHLDIRFLIRQDRLDTIDDKIGDLDGRLHGLFDALRIPQHQGQLIVEKSEIPNPCFCLLEDDSVVRSINAETLMLLNEPGDVVGYQATDEEKDKDHVVHVLVTMKPRQKEFSLFGV